MEFMRLRMLDNDIVMSRGKTDLSGVRASVSWVQELSMSDEKNGLLSIFLLSPERLAGDNNSNAGPLHSFARG